MPFCRLDQRSLPLDGKFTASADGTGVNVYIISSVRGNKPTTFCRDPALVVATV